MTRPENRLDIVQRIAQLGFWEMDAHDKRVRMSDAACALLGLGPEHRECEFEDFLRFVHEDDRDRVRAAVDASFGRQLPLDVEHRVVHPSGAVRHLNARGEMTVAEGRAVYFGTSQDITERVQRHEKAERNEVLLEIAGRMAQMGGWSFDVGTGRLTWSDEICRIHEVPSGTSPTPEEALRFFAPEWRLKIWHRFQDCLHEGLPYDEELQIVTATGRKVWVRAIGEPVPGHDGTIRQVHGAFQDITEKREAQEKLRQMARRLTAALESITDAFYTLDRQWRFTYLNRQAERLFQRPRGELLGKVVWEEFPALKGQLFYRELHRAVRENRTAVFEDFYAPFEIWSEVRAYPSADGVTIYFRDVTEAKHTAESLRVSEERFRTIAKSTTDVVWDWDLASDTVWRSENSEALFGCPAQDTRGAMRLWADQLHPDDRTRVLDHLDAAVRGRDDQWIDEYRFVRKDGRIAYVLDRGYIIRDAAGRATRMVGAMVDLTERREADARIEYLAFYDPLTQLPNRQQFMDRLQRAREVCASRKCMNALMFVDLDNFKTLNDTLGHATGDQLLQQAAHRLSGAVSHDDLVARFGGDEYVVLLENLSSDGDVAGAAARTVGERILRALSQPYKLDNYRHSTTASIGVVLFDGTGEDVGELLKRADLAMYQAKAAGRNALRFFDPGMQAALTARMALEGNLRQALREHGFVLRYQPQVDRDGRITGVEALVRWQHAERGLVSPAEFIDLAEETGLVLPLGEWVLETACRQLSEWSTRPETAQLEIAVNVSARQFHHPAFVSQVLSAFEPCGAHPSRLKLELTETSLLDNVQDTIEKMHALKQHGITFALDDFGTGYSSLAYLKQLPLDMLKIDRSFVLDLLTNANDAVIARTIIALGRNLGLRVIAEGVETTAQRDFLFEHGCEAYQGYLCAEALPAERVEEIVRRRGALH